MTLKKLLLILIPAVLVCSIGAIAPIFFPAGREPETVTEDVYPIAVLKYDREKKVCVITLYKLNENGAREDLYVAFYGFSSREDALAYGGLMK